MAGENVQDWSTTAATNSAADSSIGWAEGQAPSTVNNSARGMMAAVAKWRNLLNGSLTTGGSANVHTVTSGVSFTSLPTGLCLRLKMGFTNTTTATLNVDGIGATTIKTMAGSNLIGGELFAGAYADFRYDGTNWILLTPTRLTAGTFFAGGLTATTGTFSGALSGTTGTFSGGVSGTTGTFSGAVSGTTGTFSGAVSGTSFSMAQGSMQTGGANSYTSIYDGSNNGALHLGGTIDPTSYYRNTTHLFQSRTAGATFAAFNSTGLSVTGTGTFSGGISATTGTFSGAVSGTAATFTGAITQTIGQPRYWYLISGTNAAYSQADGSGNVNFVTGTGGLGTRMTIAAGGNISMSNSLSVGGNISAGGTVTGAAVNSSGNSSIAGTAFLGAISTPTGTITNLNGSNISLGGQMSSNTVVANGITSNGNLGVAAQMSSNTVVTNGITNNGSGSVGGNLSVGAQMSSNTVVANGITSNGAMSSAGLLTGGGVNCNGDLNVSNSAFIAGPCFAGGFFPSDERLKEDLQPIADPGAIIEATQVYDFRWKKDGKRDYGVMAQHAVTVLPSAVAHHEERDMWGVDYSKYVPILIAEVKALRARVAELEAA